MIARTTILLSLLAGLVGCAIDGGPTGTGLSASISGNVIQIEPAASDAGTGATELPPVHVSIAEVPGVEGVTAADGSFELRGEFSGLLTLRFATPEVAATQELEVPAGSVIVLEDIVVGPREIRVSVARQLGFLGSVAMVDCVEGDLLVDDRGAVANQFLVRLSSETLLVGEGGETASCDGIRAGDQIAVQGSIRLSDRTIDAITVNLGPMEPGQPSPSITLRFAGVVTLINCESQMVLIEGAAGRSRMRLSESSAIADTSGGPLVCTDIAAGDRVEGNGLIRVRRPGVIDVLDMRVQPSRLGGG